jgi:hypothetical protein
MSLFAYLGIQPPAKKQKKTKEETLEQQRLYENLERERMFLPKWHSQFKWLRYDSARGMTCHVCSQFEKGTENVWVRGCTKYRKDNLDKHGASKIVNMYA